LALLLVVTVYAHSAVFVLDSFVLAADRAEELQSVPLIRRDQAQ
jgi:hypothetical protein